MKLAFVTNIRAPYRIVQLNEFAKIDNVELTTYYTHKESENRKWESKKSIGFKEVYLDGINLLKNDSGYINKGLKRLVKDNDLIVIGGYEQPTYIMLSLLCRIYRKKYIILFDGISTNRLNNNERFMKKIIKSFVIKNSSSILGNGTVSKRYFNEIYNYPSDKIFNQYLTIDSDIIKKLYKEKNKLRIEYRKKYGIDDNEKVLLYSGRVIELKNIKIVIEALAKLNKEITMVILGDGCLKNELEKFAKKNNVKLIISGFIDNQTELFKQYYIGDCFILPSNNEVWGLVVNEAMFSGLPVLVSNICGCSLDLVKEGVNGYKIDPYSVENIKDRIEQMFFEENLNYMGSKSIDIISEWTFLSSRIELERAIIRCKNKL